MQWIFTPPKPIGLAIHGVDAQFPVQRIFCVGRNYVEHAQEMGHSGREDPFFFCKVTVVCRILARPRIYTMRLS